MNSGETVRPAAAETHGKDLKILMSYDRLYIEYLYYFNVARDYFECHEVLEELWMQEGRNPLYQGLLQVAVGLYHFRNGNVNGAVKLFTNALEKLGPFESDGPGIDMEALLADSRNYLAKLRRYAEAPFDYYDLDIRIVDPSLMEKVESLKRNPPLKEEDV